MSVRSALGKAFVAALPDRSEILFRFCRRIVNRYNGDNEGDMHVNGESMLLRAALRPGAVVFDVGANAGEWTREALALQPDARVHCFEPSPVTFAILQKNDFPPTVRLNNAGLGAANGTLELYVFAEGLGANSLYDRRGTDASTARREQVDIVTLDHYCEANGISSVDLLKIDVEGHELAVLRGAATLLEAGRIRIAQFEYGGTYIDARVLLKDVWELVGSLNPQYGFYKLFPRALQYVPQYRQTFETFQYSNWAIMTEDTARSLRLPFL